MAYIVFEKEGHKVELSKETTEKLKEELLHSICIPKYISVGQIYKINREKYMVASTGCGSRTTKGLTNVGSCYSGCYSSSILTGKVSGNELRKLLISLNAKYLGLFNEVFRTII